MAAAAAAQSKWALQLPAWALPMDAAAPVSGMQISVRKAGVELGSFEMVAAGTLIGRNGDLCGVCADQHVVSSADSFTGATVGVVEASTTRCARCWYHDSTVGSLTNHPALCARCGDAVGDDV